MKILSIAQIQQADEYTIIHEPISSIHLMERAANAFTQSFLNDFPDKNSTKIIFCGPGNNGGDGLAIARILMHQGHTVEVFAISSEHYSKDFLENAKQLNAIHFIDSDTDFPKINKNDIIIDAIFGSGLNKALDGIYKLVVNFMNTHSNNVIAVDIPSGMFADKHSSSLVIKASKTYTFQFPKLAFMFPENEKYVGDFKKLNIGLHPQFVQEINTPYHFILQDDARLLLKTRPKFSHKGTYGHALLVAGSKGKIGAAVLASKAVLRSGAGLLSVHIPECGYGTIQTSIPEAMCSTDKNPNFISQIPEYKNITAIGIGPGLGTAAETVNALHTFLQQNKCPLVLDADAINILALHPDLLKLLPANTILTPHPKEFERLVGEWKTDFERLEKQLDFSNNYNCIVVLKGAHTSITDAEGQVWFNSSGNSGMATGGSGDVLTGIILGLLAQGYQPKHAAVLGVFLHGLSGDLALESQSEESLMATDIIENMGRAFKQLQ